MSAERYLLVDLGGTNTRVASGDAHGVVAETTRSFRNRNFGGLGEVLSAYLKDEPGRVHGLCAGVAGPVQNGTAQLTNYDWWIDAADLRKVTGAQHVHLINDLQAQGYALGDVPQTSIRQVKTGDLRAGTRRVLNLGTGCNGAVVHEIGDRLFVPAAEAGHSTLPHSDGDLRALFDHLRESHAHLPIEAVLSGPGLVRVHAWVTGAAGVSLSPEAVIEEIAAGGAAAQTTLSLFLRTLGAIAGNFALHHLPMGGLYLSGGLAEAMAPYLDDPRFHEPFIARGPYTEIVRAIPIFVIAEDGFALRGCHRYLMQST